MHFTGRTWRPPYEASSFILQATSGCTYRNCSFCSLYKDEPFRMSPMEEFEEDLAELKHYQPNARRIFMAGANPFAMSYENLKLRALTVRDYLIKCQTIKGLYLPPIKDSAASTGQLNWVCLQFMSILLFCKGLSFLKVPIKKVHSCGYYDSCYNKFMVGLTN